MNKEKLQQLELQVSEVRASIKAKTKARYAAKRKQLFASLAIVINQRNIRYRDAIDRHDMRLVYLVGGTFTTLVTPFAFFYFILDYPYLGIVSSLLLTLTILAIYRLLFCGNQEQNLDRIFRANNDVRQATAEVCDLASELEKLRDLLQEHEQAAADARLELEAISKHEREAVLQKDFEYLSDQLATENWRAMKATEFENFVARIFVHLGYQALDTAVTGDQGVDIVVVAGQHRLAVQTKGYFNSVSNSAVQEAVAGMAYYKCSRCCVVTNSRFTASATALAEANDCILIGEENFVEFIFGRVIPRLASE